MKRHVTLITNIIILIIFSALIIQGFNNNSIYVNSSISKEPIYKGNTSKKQVSLMINVYWGTEYIEPMLTELKKYNVKCTFFIGGSWVDDNNEILLKIYNDGHEIGNHGYFHKDHKQLSYKANREEIIMTEQLVKAICSCKTNLFAPPSGSIGSDMIKVCNDLDYSIIMWSKDTIDWRDKNTQLIYDRATKNLSNGDLILMHPTKNTLEALPNILKFYNEQGFNVVTVSQNLEMS